MSLNMVAGLLFDVVAKPEVELGCVPRSCSLASQTMWDVCVLAVSRLLTSQLDTSLTSNKTNSSHSLSRLMAYLHSIEAHSLRKKHTILSGTIPPQMCPMKSTHRISNDNASDFRTLGYPAIRVQWHEHTLDVASTTYRSLVPQGVSISTLSQFQRCSGVQLLHLTCIWQLRHACSAAMTRRRMQVSSSFQLHFETCRANYLSTILRSTKEMATQKISILSIRQCLHPSTTGPT